LLNVNRKILINNFSNNISVFYLIIENQIVEKVKYILYIVNYNITNSFVFAFDK